MNTKKNTGFRGFGIYILLIFVIIGIWYFVTGSSATSTLTKEKLWDAIGQNKVTKIVVVQNRDVPTGKLNITYENKRTDTLYVTDVNEIQEELDKAGYTSYVVNDIPKESWIMTILPYLLIFGAFFILFMIMTSNANAQGGGS